MVQSSLARLIAGDQYMKVKSIGRDAAVLDRHVRQEVLLDRLVRAAATMLDRHMRQQVGY